MKRKLLLTALCTLIGMSQVKAYTTTDLTNAGWTLVTDFASLTLNENYFMLVDAQEGIYSVANAMPKGIGESVARPVYMHIEDPFSAFGQVWAIESYGEGTYSIQSIADNYYLNSSGDWWSSHVSNEKSANSYIAITSLGEGIYRLRSSQQPANNYWGPYKDSPTVDLTHADGKDLVTGATENNYASLAANKGTTNAPGFYLYAMSRSTYNANRRYSGTLENEGWTKVTAASGLGLSGYYYAFLDASENGGESGYVMTGTGGRPQYKLGKNPLEDKTQLWTTEAHGDGYAIKNMNDDQYIYSAADWDMKSTSSIDTDHTDYLFSVSAGVWTLSNSINTSAFVGNYKNSPYNPTDGEELASNKAAKKGKRTFIIYSIPTIAGVATTFNSGDAVSEDTWYALSVGSGIYRIASTNAATLSYSQDGSKVVSSSFSSTTISAGGSSALSLTAGTFYFKSTAGSTITITQWGAAEDITNDFITNPSFEIGTPNYYKGWTVDVSSGSSTSDGQERFEKPGMGDGSTYRFRIWTSDAGAATVKQTLTSLPAGNYKLSAYFASGANDVFTLTAGSTSKKVIAADGNATLVEVYFTQASTGNIEISARHDTNWFALDNFHLIYNPSLPASLTEVSGKMSSTASTTQTTDVEAYYADRTFENLLTAQASMTAAVNSRVVYNNIATIRSTYQSKVDDDLDAAGKSAYTTAINTASTGAETMYAAGDYERAAQAEEAYHSDYVTAVKAQTTENTDMTEAIVNPSFESDLSTGWSTGDMGRQNNTAFDKKSGTYYVERWHDAGDKYVKQTLSGFHAGLYTMTATAYASKSTSPKVYVKVGGTENSTPVSDSKDYCVSFNYDGSSTLEIGFSATLESDGWVCVDNFRLTYDGAALPASLDEVTGNMNADLRDAANAAISTYNSSNTIENYSAAQTAIAAAEASREVYVTISGIMTTYQGKANALDAAGQAAYTSAINTATTGAASKYNDGTYTTAAEAETAFTADYRTAVKAQVTAGSDMTDAIINPSFETGNISPWTSADGGGVASNNNWSSGKVGTYFVERWQTSASGGLSDGTLTQTLTDMPAGRYTLTANAQNIEQYNSSEHGTGYYLTLGSEQTEVTSGILTTVTYDLAAAGNLTIGMKLDDCTGNWVSCDNFRLTYVGVEKNVTVAAKAGKYGTVILPFAYNFAEDGDFSNIKFYSCASVNNSYTQIEEVSTPAANTPYIIKNNGVSDFSKIISGFSVAEESSYTVGLLTGVYTNADIPVSDASYSYYVLQTHDDGVQAFYKVDAAFTATAYKCYLKVPVTTPPVKAFKFDIFDAINAIETAENENTEIYNLAGQRMSKAQKGVNIINGKKVLVK